MGIKLYRTYDRGPYLLTKNYNRPSYLPTKQPTDLIRSGFLIRFNDDDRIVRVALIGGNVILRNEKWLAERRTLSLCSYWMYRVSSYGLVNLII